MERAIESLRAASPRGRRVLVSGDMLELGPYERKAHTRLGTQAAEAGIDLFVAVGPLSRLPPHPAPAARRGAAPPLPPSEAAAALLASLRPPGGLVPAHGGGGIENGAGGAGP